MPKVRLDSWKSIADYLERSPRTVQRWHAYHALPVHHFGGCKGSVFAYTEEIDRWLMSLAQENRLSDVGGDDSLAARRLQSRELVLRAHEMWESRTEESLHTIAGLYRKGIEQNPANTEALTGLANAMISAALHGVMDGAIAFPAATEALRRAAQLRRAPVSRMFSPASPTVPSLWAEWRSPMLQRAILRAPGPGSGRHGSGTLWSPSWARWSVGLNTWPGRRMPHSIWLSKCA
jgi:hypothetical protein